MWDHCHHIPPCCHRYNNQNDFNCKRNHWYIKFAKMVFATGNYNLIWLIRHSRFFLIVEKYITWRFHYCIVLSIVAPPRDSVDNTWSFNMLTTFRHYVGKALRRLSAWDPGCGGPSTPIRVGHPWAAARCAALVQRFSQWPVKIFFFSNRCKSQNKHQNWILQLETNKSSGRTTEFHRV